MVKGLETFRDFFRDHSESYVIIGGTACDLLHSYAGFEPRTTKDIDIILVVEKLTQEFVQQLWRFIKEGEYESLEKEAKERKYYRFKNPARMEFPKQIELFSRTAGYLDDGEGARFAAINVGDDISRLSAILLDSDYYDYTIEHSSQVDGLHRANPEALICLKARAFLDLADRKAQDGEIDEKDIKKHKNDVFRLTALLKSDDRFPLSGAIKADMIRFADAMTGRLPDNAIFKEMKASGVDSPQLFAQLRENFELGR